MSHNTVSIALILNIRIKLDRSDFKLNHDTIKVHFTSLLIELVEHKLATSFRKSIKIGQKQGIKYNEKLYNVKCAITGVYDVYLYFY